MARKDPTSIKALHEVEKRLNCAICLDLFTDPKSLPCGHVFCNKCLGQLDLRAREGDRVLVCPICRIEVALPEGGISGYPSAFHMNDLLELRHQLEKLSEAKVVACENCSQHDATGFCRQCGTFLCRKCTQTHSLLSRIFPNHEIVGLKEVISSVTQLIPVKQQPTMECLIHEKSLVIYCETCSELLCLDCTIRQHKDHQCHSITDEGVYQKHLQQIQRLVLPAKEKLSTVRVALQALTKRSEEMLGNKQRVKKRIEDWGRQLIAKYTAAVQECVHCLMGELEEGSKGKLNVLATQREEAKKAASLLENRLDYVEQELKMGSKVQILANKGRMMVQIQQAISEVKVDSFNPAEEADLGFDADKEMAKMPATIGRVTFSNLASRCRVTGNGVTTAVANRQASFQLVIKPPSTGIAPSIPISLISCQLTPLSGSRTSHCDVTEMGCGMYKVTYTPTSSVTHQLRVRVGGVEVSGSPFTASVVPSPAMRGGPIRSITGLDKPCYAVLNGDRLVVTELGRHCVTVLDKCGKKIMSFGSQGSALGQFRCPTGITITPDNHILVVDLDNSRIQRFSMDGKVIAAVGSKGTGPLKFNFPQNIVVHPSGKVLVANKNSHCIQVLNPDLSFSHMFGSRGAQAGQFRFPYDMSIDNEGMVYITDSNNCRIMKFTIRGEYVAELKGEMNYPNGIAIDENNILYVANNHFISIFDTNGKFLTKFGKEGCGDTEFNVPYGVVVDKNGDLYVCDCNNDRIVVY